jgi:hypothetical protein
MLVGLLWARESRAEQQERTAIKVTRIYTGSDNQTHAEEYEVQLGAPRSATELAEPIEVTSLLHPLAWRIRRGRTPRSSTR